MSAYKKFLILSSSILRICFVIEMAEHFKASLIDDPIVYVVQVLQEQVEKQQQEVNSLQNMVVVVDDANSDEGKQIKSMGNRFSIN